jgi:hypothetical protein
MKTYIPNGTSMLDPIGYLSVATGESGSIHSRLVDRETDRERIRPQSTVGCVLKGASRRENFYGEKGTDNDILTIEAEAFAIDEKVPSDRFELLFSFVYQSWPGTEAMFIIVLGFLIVFRVSKMSFEYEDYFETFEDFIPPDEARRTTGLSPFVGHRPPALRARAKCRGSYGSRCTKSIYLKDRQM